MKTLERALHLISQVSPSWTSDKTPMEYAQEIVDRLEPDQWEFLAENGPERGSYFAALHGCCDANEYLEDAFVHGDTDPTTGEVNMDFPICTEIMNEFDRLVREKIGV